MLMNVSQSQSLYLQAGFISIKIWLEGNGSTSYLVNSAGLRQGSKVVSLKCLGAMSFYVPPLGRWSDLTSLTGFTVPGTAILDVSFRGDVPVLNLPPEKKTIRTTPIISNTGVISKVYANISNDILFDCEFEGTFVDSVNGFTPIVVGDVEIETSSPIFGVGSLKINGDNPEKEIIQPQTITGVTITEWVSGEGLTEYLNFANVEGILHLYLSAGFETGVILAGNGSHTIFNDYNSITVSVVFSEIPSIPNNTGLSDSIGLINVYPSVTYDVAALSDTFEENGITISCFYGVGETRQHVAQVFQKAEGGYNCKVYMEGQNMGGIFVEDENVGAFWAPRVISESVAVIVDGYQIIKGALWTSNFTPPSQPFTSITTESTTNDIIEAKSTATITIGTNPANGDTLTVKIGNDTTIYTFVTLPTGESNEIVIGPTTTITAANIVATLNSAFGALFSATSAGNVVTIIVYTSEDVSITTTCSGITIGTITKSFVYTTFRSPATLPAITCSADGVNWGELGDIYVLSSLPKLILSGSGSRSGNVTDTYLPSFTSSGQVFEPTGSSASTDAAKEALLLCGNSWMETFSSMVIAPGTWDEIALQAVKWVADYIAYTTDTGLDNWKDPIRTLYDGSGDCEDGAFLTASLIRNMGVPYSNIRVYIGETSGVGHAWIMYRRTSDNQWVSLDWTAGSAYWSGITSVDNLTALYSSVFEIQEQSLNPDDYAYGLAVEYITCSDVISLANGREYSDSLYSPTYSLTIEDSFPSLLFNAYSGGYITDNFPSLLFSATGVLSPTSALKLSFPVLRFSANAIQSALAGINLTNPALRFSASGIISSIISLSAIAPSLIFKATGFTGDSGKIIKSFPSLKFTATAHWTGNNTIDIDIPFILFNALARNSVILDADGRKVAEGLALCMNTKNFSMTEYDNYGYNSLFEFNGKIFGATSTGIHELTGDTDNNNPVLWRFKIGKIDLEKNIKTKARYIWLSYRSSGDLILTIDDGENQYEYDVESYKQIDNAVRIKIGKGLRNRFVQIELENVNGASMTFDHLRLFSDLTKKKR